MTVNDIQIEYPIKEYDCQMIYKPWIKNDYILIKTHVSCKS